MAFSYSFDEESYYGAFDTRERAAAEATAEGKTEGGRRFFTARNVPPAQPEEFWHADDWLERVSEQDEYAMDCAEDWDQSNADQHAELEAEVRAVMAAWLDRHKLRPRFYTVEDVQEHQIDEPAAVEN